MIVFQLPMLQQELLSHIHQPIPYNGLDQYSEFLIVPEFHLIVLAVKHSRLCPFEHSVIPVLDCYCLLLLFS